ncbi:carbohydrate ABC transporter permease [Paenibacillus sp. FSL H8-0034]|uniref:carbohydrate ABC transporter permease n=1 Tax=Paenibacillus sp. FSL H8-0034 TaxID=2954671 RepID=UPI0030F5BD4E
MKLSLRLPSFMHYLLLTVLAVIMIYPVYFAISYAFMTTEQVQAYPPSFFPESFQFENFILVTQMIPIIRFILNSFVVSMVITAGHLLTASLAAYAFSFLQFRGRNTLFAIFLATMMVPWEVTVIPNFMTIQQWGWMDSYLGLTVPHIASVFGIFMFRQFFLQLPRELFDAAKIDGCGHMRTFASIVIPLSRPAIGTFMVYSFLKAWNMYLWPLLITNNEKMRTVQIGITMLKNEDYSHWNLILAGVTLVFLPSLLLLILGMKQLVSGITGGAVKQ